MLPGPEKMSLGWQNLHPSTAVFIKCLANYSSFYKWFNPGENSRFETEIPHRGTWMTWKTGKQSWGLIQRSTVLDFNSLFFLVSFACQWRHNTSDKVWFADGGNIQMELLNAVEECKHQSHRALFPEESKYHNHSWNAELLLPVYYHFCVMAVRVWLQSEERREIPGGTVLHSRSPASNFQYWNLCKSTFMVSMTIRPEEHEKTF